MTTSGDGRQLCAACGSPVTPALGTCSWCGQPFEVVTPAVAPSSPPAAAEGPTADADALSTAAAGRRPRVSRRWLVLGGAGTAVVAAAVVVVVLLTSGGSDTPSPLDQRAKDARDVAAALASLGKDPSVARAGSTAVAGVDARAAVAPGSTVEADETTWRPDGAGGGVMSVSLTAPDGTTSTYLAVMVHEDGGWKVLGTFPAPTASPSAPSSSSSPSSSPSAVAS